MHRDTFLKSMTALAVRGGLPLSAFADTLITMTISANLGGGWDATGRALGKTMLDAKVVAPLRSRTKVVLLVPLAWHSIVNTNKGDPNAISIGDGNAMTFLPRPMSLALP